MDEDGSVIGPVHLPTDHEEIEANHVLSQCKIYHSTVMMRRDAMRRSGGYNIEYWNAEDYELWLRMAEIGKLANLQETAARYRLRESGLSGSDYKGQISHAWRACAIARERRGLIPLDYSLAPEASYLPVSSWQRSVQLGWIAWSGGQRRSWRRFTVRALRAAPMRGDSWRLAFFGFFKRPKIKP